MKLLAFWVILKPPHLWDSLCLCLSGELGRHSVLEILQRVASSFGSKRFCLGGALSLFLKQARWNSNKVAPQFEPSIIRQS